MQLSHLLLQSPERQRLNDDHMDSSEVTGVLDNSSSGKCVCVYLALNIREKMGGAKTLTIPLKHSALLSGTCH